MCGNLRSRVLRFVLSGGLAATAVILAGCRTTPPPNLGRGPLTPQEISDIQMGKKAVVLFRLTTTENGTQESLDFQRKVRWRTWRIGGWQRFHYLTDGSKSTPSEWRTPPAANRNDGWRYLVLPPGGYFIEPRPAVAHDNPYPLYHLSVPEGHKIVYAGSFLFTASNGTGLYIPGGVHDDSAAAQAIAKGLVPSVDEVTAAIATPNDLAVAVKPYAGRKLTVMATTNYPMDPTPDVGRKAGVLLAAPVAVTGIALLGLAIWTADTADDDDTVATDYDYDTKNPKTNKTVHHHVSADDDKDGLIVMELLAGGVGFTLIGAAFPIEEVGDLTFGGIVRRTWKPHEAAIRQDIKRFDQAGHLATALPQLLATNGIDPSHPMVAAVSETPTNLVVQVGTCHSGLQPEDFFGWKYMFKTSAYLSVIDPVSHQVIWEHGYLYANLSGSPGQSSYVTVVSSRQKSYSLGAYKGAAGEKLLQQKLEAADRRLSEAMAADLKAAGF